MHYSMKIVSPLVFVLVLLFSHSIEIYLQCVMIFKESSILRKLKLKFRFSEVKLNKMEKLNRIIQLIRYYH